MGPDSGVREGDHQLLRREIMSSGLRARDWELRAEVGVDRSPQPSVLNSRNCHSSQQPRRHIRARCAAACGLQTVADHARQYRLHILGHSVFARVEQRPGARRVYQRQRGAWRQAAGVAAGLARMIDQGLDVIEQCI